MLFNYKDQETISDGNCCDGVSQLLSSVAEQLDYTAAWFVPFDFYIILKKNIEIQKQIAIAYKVQDVWPVPKLKTCIQSPVQSWPLPTFLVQLDQIGTIFIEFSRRNRRVSPLHDWRQVRIPQRLDVGGKVKSAGG